MPYRLANLAVPYTYRYRHLGEINDLEKSLECRLRALALTPDGQPDMPDQLANLAVSYTDRYRRLGDLADLEKSLIYRSRALALTSDAHPDMATRLADLAVSYGNRYGRLGDLDDLEKSLEYGSRALELTPNGHPDIPAQLGNLAVSYTHRYQRLGKLEDLEKPLEYRLRVLELTPGGHPDMSVRLANLAVSYSDRYRRLGDLEDLEKSLIYRSRALALTSDGHPDMPDRLAHLAVSHTDRYRRLGGLEDLEKSLEYGSRALELTPGGHPEMPVQLANLAVSYSDRYRRLGELDDLEKALEYDSHALALTPEGHRNMPDRLVSLAVSYGDRYGRLGELHDLEKSLEYNSCALKLTPDGHPDMSVQLSNLAVSHNDRYRRLGNLDDLEKSLEYGSRALELTPDGHPHIPAQLGNLAMSYIDRYGCLGNLNDLEKSLEHSSRAVSLTPHGHSDLSQYHFYFAISLLHQFQHTRDSSHSIKSLNSFRVAAQLLTASPRQRFKIALAWANNATKHTSLNPIEAYQAAINLLPQFIWLGATTTQRYQDLSTAGSLAVNAAYVAVLSSQYMLALEWLEHARCVVWTQSLMLRSPLDQLRSSHPDLSTQLQTVADQLHGAGSETQAIKPITSASNTPQRVGQQRHRLAREYEKLLGHVRLLPGFKDFLQPMGAKRLIRAARNGPIVIINCHQDQCNALLILPGQDDVRQLSLPTFTQKIAQDARSKIETSLKRMGLRERGFRPWKQVEYKDQFENVLAMLWTNIVKPVLDFLGYMNHVPGGILPHITWCPTGALTFLPLHAAGDYTQPRSKVFDYVMSSYTPTLTALLSSTPNTLNRGCRVLGVGQAFTPGRSPLPGTVRELAQLKARMKNDADYSQLIDDQATTTAVLDAMERHDWVHLACHAHQNIKDPTRSGFFLHDGTLDLAAINRRSFRNKGLAFLSACQTAKGDEMLPDEAIHLASGMLIAGYPSVIATMWSVSDSDAPLVSDKVYAQLMVDGKVGDGQAGRALHYAVAALREKAGEKAFGRWVPYIHIGS
ncbi:unnamed protein product [Rhizoctonia solani]|uniref:CHAT domain-containing protein n=1 Tax=Rhizoctonia solani TaxID=456999 RepID=A0A8H3G681_9AGAM|nr:unnamed protein product [Rhizoctonia solani]